MPQNTIKKEPRPDSRKDPIFIENGKDPIFIENEINRYVTKLIKNGKEIGDFRVDRLPPHMLGISIEEEYRGKGLSKILIKKMCKELKKLKGIILDDTYLYIDTDASWEPDSEGILKSYWDYLGMEKISEGEYYGQGEGAGQDKKITFQNLCKNFSGGKKTRKTKTRKTKTRKTKTRKTKTRKTKTRKTKTRKTRQTRKI
jgi:hypothetical protein